ncbi:hypothetical protein [Roseibium sediminis]|uniref:hypothetical protein n=1 Tax=Roseibium sediminis TaxID=1775174 RepID=UPI00123C9EB5|nr:hypothetical protein [Roseibium sediminis]
MPTNYSLSELQAIAHRIYTDDTVITTEEELQELLEKAINYNVYVFIAGFVCNKEFGHSSPEELTGEDAEHLIRLADPIVQFAKLFAERRGEQ